MNSRPAQSGGSGGEGETCWIEVEVERGFACRELSMDVAEGFDLQS